MPDRRDGRDPFANLDSSKLVSVDGKDERPPAKRTGAASEGQFAPQQDEAVLELDLPPPRRGTTAPQPRPTGPLPPPSRHTGPLPPPPPWTLPPPPPRTTGPISAPPPAARATVPLPPPGPQSTTIAAPARRSSRIVFVGGMALALALAFLPAHLYASMAERGYDTIRMEATHTEPAVNAAVYQSELEEREAAIGRLRRAKSRIGATAAIIWLATAGGLGFAWIRLVQSRIPDDA